MYFSTPKMQAIWDNFPPSTRTGMENAITPCPTGHQHILSINVGVANPANVGLVRMICCGGSCKNAMLPAHLQAPVEHRARIFDWLPRERAKSRTASISPTGSSRSSGRKRVRSQTSSDAPTSSPVKRTKRPCITPRALANLRSSPPSDVPSPPTVPYPGTYWYRMSPLPSPSPPPSSPFPTLREMLGLPPSPLMTTQLPTSGEVVHASSAECSVEAGQPNTSADPDIALHYQRLYNIENMEHVGTEAGMSLNRLYRDLSNEMTDEFTICPDALVKLHKLQEAQQAEAKSAECGFDHKDIIGDYLRSAASASSDEAGPSTGIQRTLHEQWKIASAHEYTDAKGKARARSPLTFYRCVGGTHYEEVSFDDLDPSDEIIVC